MRACVKLKMSCTVRTSTRVLPRDVYFHMFTSTRRVFSHVYFNKTFTLHDMNKCGSCKHVTGMHSSIVVVSCKITRGKMKLQLSGTVCIYIYIYI